MIQFAINDEPAHVDAIRLTLARDQFGNPCVVVQGPDEDHPVGALMRFLADGTIGAFHSVNPKYGFLLGVNDCVVLRGDELGNYVNAKPGTEQDTPEQQIETLVFGSGATPSLAVLMRELAGLQEEAR